MTTNAQNNANRRNAANSTGPRTEVGKEASSQNATRHGAYSARPRAIRSGAFQEDPEEVEAYVAGIVEALAPRDHLEYVEALNIAAAYLRLRRLELLEIESLGGAGLKAPHLAISAMLESDDIVDDDERRASHARTMLEQVLTVSSRIESRNTISLDRALRRYDNLRKRDLPDS